MITFLFMWDLEPGSFIPQYPATINPTHTLVRLQIWRSPWSDSKQTLIAIKEGRR